MLENVNVIKEHEVYDILYSVPKHLQSTLDMYIEECVGADGIALLDDCQEQETDIDIVGTITLVFDKEHPYNECYVEEVAGYLQMLTRGEDILESEV